MIYPDIEDIDQDILINNGGEGEEDWAPSWVPKLTPEEKEEHRIRDERLKK